MHSSRMRTARSLTDCISWHRGGHAWHTCPPVIHSLHHLICMPPPGSMYAPWQTCMSPRSMHAPQSRMPPPPGMHAPGKHECPLGSMHPRKACTTPRKYTHTPGSMHTPLVARMPPGKHVCPREACRPPPRGSTYVPMWTESLMPVKT